MTDASATVRPLLRVRQVREFTGEPLAHEMLDALADVARWSGSSRNRQPWRFVIIGSAETLRAIHDAGAPLTRSLETAAAAIAIAMPSEPGSGVSHAFDEGRAAERILIGASLLGIGAGIAWIQPAARRAVGDLLGMPEDRFVRTVVALGHPTEAALRPKSRRGEARLPRQDTVFRERWPAQ